MAYIAGIALFAAAYVFLWWAAERFGALVVFGPLMAALLIAGLLGL